MSAATLTPETAPLPILRPRTAEATTTARNVQIPTKLAPLFQKFRYKVVYGGRGGAKSWNLSRALLILGSRTRLRILCAREVQKSIKDSVHKLLKDQIELLGLGHFYTVLETEIRGQNGTEFIFSGLQGHTVESLKSYEGVDICWVEEAHVVSKHSWDILCPTIRKAGSEIWISFNPQLDTDETWVRFVLAPPAQTVVIEMNYPDNPWFTPELELERQHTEKVNPDDYNNIWLGRTRAAVDGAIYAREMAAITQSGRITLLPYDPRLKVHAVWDMGWNDAMAIGFVQRAHSECRIINYLEGSYRGTDEWAAELLKLNYNWGKTFLPFADGFSGTRHNKGKTDADILKAFGFTVHPKEQTPNISIEAGIRAARMLFPRVYFAKGQTERLIECMKRYRRVVNREGTPGEPAKDEYTHGADMFRYIAINIESMRNDELEAPKGQPFRPVDAGLGMLGSALLVITCLL